MTPTEAPPASRALLPPSGSDPAHRARLDGLLKLVGLGDRDAFASLYDAVSARVFGLTRTVLRNDSLAQEVTQDVFLEVWQRAGRFDSSKGSALSWVMTLAHSRAVDKVRHHQAVHLRDHRHAVISYQPDVDVVLQDVLAGQDRQQLRHAMGSITARQHEAISLTFFAGHTYRDASVMLGVPLSTLKTRIRDGLINLRTALVVENESTRTKPTTADVAAAG